MAEGDIALVGLAVMGQNLILNMNDHGFTVVAFNRTTSKVDDFLNGPAKGTKVIGAKSPKEVVDSLKKPRKIMFMVKAGEAVDALIEEFLPLLDKGDILIDGGNSHYPDTQRRVDELAPKGILYMGCGVSGGEDGARHGPSLMPGGHEEAWEHVKDILQTIAAKADNGEPCCDYVGKGGAGHYVKMVHNGIEYGDIQLISEAYDMMKNILGMSEDEMSETFKEWNKGELDSYLIEIAAAVLEFKDTDGKPLITKILDKAGQKGTGKWTGQSALEEGVDASLITEAVFARCLSSMKEERMEMAKHYRNNPRLFTGDKKEMIENIRKALYLSKIISYAQGYMLMRSASEKYQWDLNMGGIALMWRNGCIIRSVFLGEIKKAFDKNKDLKNLMLDDFFKKAIVRSLQGGRKAVLVAMEHGRPVPCFTSAFAFYDGITSELLPANMIQALRDYFGAHTFERVDNPGKPIHNNWTGHGGSAASGSYNA